MANHSHIAFKMASSKENLLVELAKHAQIDFQIAILTGQDTYGIRHNLLSFWAGSFSELGWGQSVPLAIPLVAQSLVPSEG